MTTTRAEGTFETQTTPHPPYDTAEGAVLARMTIAKTFAGDLEGTSVVEMIAARTAVAGSAGYVAIERVSGVLHGKRGTFVLQHSGTMDRGAMSLSVSVVPDSGTGELMGITGSMSIDIVEKQHFYAFDYVIAPRA